ncbi:MAG: hypothetical protein ACPGVD_09350, partial [Flavobacteriales bacterium]
KSEFKLLKKLLVEKQLLDSAPCETTTAPRKVTSFKNRIAILSLTLFVIGFSIEVLSQFYILKNMGVFKLYAIGIIVSFLMMCFAVFNKSEKGWWLKKSQKIELHTIITILVAHSLTLVSFIFLN